MKQMDFRKPALALLAAATGLAVLATPALAARDPEYAAARKSGQVGEKMDGYLGIVGAETADLRRVVSKINILRRDNYTTRAQAQGATLEEYAFTQGCILILRTVPGEKYQAPNGSWLTRTSAPPQRHVQCP